MEKKNSPDLASAFLWIEVVPLVLFLAAAFIFYKYRAQIIAALIASPVPPYP